MKTLKVIIAHHLKKLGHTPRWLVLVIDLLINTISLWITVFLFEKIGIKAQSSGYERMVLILAISFLFLWLFKSQRGLVRHSTFRDIWKIFFITISILFASKAVSWLWQRVYGYPIFLDIHLVVNFVLSFFLLSFFRITVKEFFRKINEWNNGKKQHWKIIALGTDTEMVSVAKVIRDNPYTPYDLVGFLVDGNIGKATLLGKKIIKKQSFLAKSKAQLQIDGVLINQNALSRSEIAEWTNIFLDKGLKVLKTPRLQKVRSNQDVKLKSLQIEDLLHRKPIVIENQEVIQKHFQKNILVTGGAGSIGSELIRQIATFKSAQIVVLDQAETPLHDIELELREKFPTVSFKFVLADISNRERLERIFQKYHFSIVYHAAAYKHVPLIEENPYEAILVNIQGTRNVALLSSKYKVERFVMISTDKAVNPTNVMGASKRTAELFVQALQKETTNTTKFITTRFGNVLGSNGSVIPHFKRQIEKGGPITITHPDIVRYFMTIPEACELVLQAGTMGMGGEIFVFDMGEPIKILNLAIRMIKLSGYEPETDIKIVYTGLRPGEKLYEELLSDNTKTLPTHHEKIMISKDPSVPFDQINQLSEKIVAVAQTGDKLQMVRVLKEIVKEFKSNNSIYEELDK
ncbi:polysaccharide biosynthesis protein [Capnocytophaga canis]|uniref:Putative UDP-GlcNAc-4,6-dehydratase n=1 Tax=Capnocytophaga canis TaxID=1848903 RepID=A0A0B7HYI2_9FLAO|nr:nucleoside-diphosphate sugar epimerase/dehydratase [Capnocytophaga canis]CEN44485.1 putative UDP-GlcNAc-4,6-dehydratase [Capnocytophaga canis]